MRYNVKTIIGIIMLVITGIGMYLTFKQPTTPAPYQWEQNGTFFIGNGSQLMAAVFYKDTFVVSSPTGNFRSTFYGEWKGQTFHVAKRIDRHTYRCTVTDTHLVWYEDNSKVPIYTFERIEL